MIQRRWLCLFFFCAEWDQGYLSQPMGLSAGFECSQQAQSAILLPGLGEHRSPVPLHTEQVNLFSCTPFVLTVVSCNLVTLCLLPDSLPPGCEFGQADMQKLVPKEEKPSGSTTTPAASGSRRTGNIIINLFSQKTELTCLWNTLQQLRLSVPFI